MSATAKPQSGYPPDARLVPRAAHRAEIQVVNSTFIASIGPASSVDEARQFIQQVRDEFPDATHNVPAFVIGHGASVIEHCQDDGEPSGTAGRPMLAVLRGSGIGDIVAVVTRYFGGTKLGKGGLVRAYGDAVKAGLEALPLARKVATDTIMAAVPYSFLEQARRIVTDYAGEVLDETFGVDVTMTVRLEAERTDELNAALVDSSHGTVVTETLHHDPETRFPI